MDGVEGQFAYPIFVKPAGTGSSVGVSKARDREGLDARADSRPGNTTARCSSRNSSRGRRSRWPCSAMRTRRHRSAARSSRVRISMITRRNISPTAPTSISRPASRKRRRSRCARPLFASIRSMGCRGLSRVDFFVTREGRGRVQRDQHDPRLHVDLDVPEAL